MGFIADDLARECASIRNAAARGDLVCAVNHDVHVQNETWNIDLALGPPTGDALPVPAGTIRRATNPAAIRLAIEAKAIMTRHVGARRNRRRDVGAFRDYMENFEPQAVRGAITIVNMATTFKSTIGIKRINRHGNIEVTVKETATIFRNVPLRPLGSERGTVDANCMLVIEYDGVDQAAARLVTKKPAPQEGDPISYGTFLQRLCDAYGKRWGAGTGPALPPELSVSTRQFSEEVGRSLQTHLE